MKILGSRLVKDSKSELSQALICRADNTDLENVKSFILRQHSLLQDMDYFIIDDIDSELRTLLNEQYGYFYTAVCKDSIIATQAIDFCINNEPEATMHIDIQLPRQKYEIGWTMVDPIFRRQGISYDLSMRLEDEVLRKTNTHVCIATIHPLNIASLSLYFRLGYFGIQFLTHHLLPRIIFIKLYGQRIVVVGESIIVHCSNLEKLQQLFLEGYCCISITEIHGVQCFEMKKRHG